MEQLYILGTGNATVTRCYNTCFALKNPQEQFFMIDTGGGNGILRILEDMNMDLGRIHHIFITHEHTDHLLGIVWLIRVIATRMKNNQYEGDLNIYCHQDLPETITTICRLTVQGKFFKLPDMPGGMPSLRRTCLPAQTMHESSQFTVSFIPFSCYTIHEDISTLQSTAW